MRKDTQAVDGGSVTLGREDNEDPGPRGKWEQPLHMERLEDAEKDLHFVNGINGLKFVTGAAPEHLFRTTKTPRKLFHQEAPMSLLSFSIRGQTD